MKNSRLLISNKSIILSLLLVIALFVLPRYAHAEMQLNRFVSDSYKTFIAQFQGDSFLLILWSVDCPPCIEELPVPGKFHQLHPAASVVMVSTDSENQRTNIQHLMHKHGLNDIHIPQWIFSGDSVQAIRYAIDPIWHGEWPRSYFHQQNDNQTYQHQVKSGKLDEKTLLAWIKTTSNRTTGL